MSVLVSVLTGIVWQRGDKLSRQNTQIYTLNSRLTKNAMICLFSESIRGIRVGQKSYVPPRRSIHAIVCMFRVYDHKHFTGQCQGTGEPRAIVREG